MTIYKVRTFGHMTVYERDRQGSTEIPKYFVLDERTEKILEEFRRKRPALDWARKNQNG